MSFLRAAGRVSRQVRLFKLVFGSVTLFSEQDPSNSNEPILQPHLGTIIKTSLKVSAHLCQRRFMA